MAFLCTTASRSSPLLLFLLLILPLSALAQFQFFEQMFNNPSQAQQHAQHSPQQQNVASDSSWYRKNYDGAYCSNYLCPGTLACVHFPHHCPCAWPAQEDKFELAEGSAICVSKKGWKEGELGRRVELARKGWI